MTAIPERPDPLLPQGNDALSDGRQSQTALDIARGTVRLFADLGFAAIPELSLANRRRADIVALSPKGEIWIAEIKSSLADFQADGKWPEYLDYCDRFYFAVTDAFPMAVLPDNPGLIISDRYGAEIVRAAPQEALSAARRKQVHVAFARTAAQRLTRLADPDAGLETHWRGD